MRSGRILVDYFSGAVTDETEPVGASINSMFAGDVATTVDKFVPRCVHQSGPGVAALAKANNAKNDAGTADAEVGGSLSGVPPQNCHRNPKFSHGTFYLTPRVIRMAKESTPGAARQNISRVTGPASGPAARDKRPEPVTELQVLERAVEGCAGTTTTMTMATASTAAQDRNDGGVDVVVEQPATSVGSSSSSSISSVSSGANSVFSEKEYETSVEDSSPEVGTNCSHSASGKGGAHGPLDDIKSAFVETLVDSAVLLIDTIWPGECLVGGMPLRRFIEETLKRSRSSYSAFQVSLYYLICVKPRVLELRKQHQGGCDCGVLKCGRRTFLSALILASKFLQDRNYSMGAWSKISGLSTKELAANELQVLAAIDWNVFVPTSIYTKWTTILMRAPGEDAFTWMRLVSVLNRELEVALPPTAAATTAHTVKPTKACTAVAGCNTSAGRKRAFDVESSFDNNGFDSGRAKRVCVTVAE